MPIATQSEVDESMRSSQTLAATACGTLSNMSRLESVPRRGLHELAQTIMQCSLSLQHAVCELRSALCTDIVDLSHDPNPSAPNGEIEAAW